MKRFMLAVVMLFALEACRKDYVEPVETHAEYQRTFQSEVLVYRDSTNGATCYSTGYHNISCVK